MAKAQGHAVGMEILLVHLKPNATVFSDFQIFRYSDIRALALPNANLHARESASTRLSCQFAQDHQRMGPSSIM